MDGMCKDGWDGTSGGGRLSRGMDGRLFVAALHDLRLISDSPFPSTRPPHPTAMPRQQQPQPQSTPQQQEETAAEGAKANGAVVQANNGTAAGEANGEQDKEGQEEKEKEKGGCASDWKDMRGRSLCQSASAALVCPSCPCPER